MKLSYLNLTTTDPAWNLAAEQYVFDYLPRDRMYFMLWQNDNAIIIGKHQNTLAQINEPYVKAHGIRVVRRLSGGGAVYHDLGNLNFTFIADAVQKDTLDLQMFCQPVLRALEKIGIQAQVNGRNDITIAGKKFSGNSQYVKNGRVMHHGTILFRSDLNMVGQALQVDPEKIQAKGVQSVRSRVTNVSEHLDCQITLEQFRALLLESVLRENPGEEYILTAEDLTQIEQLRAARYDTWQWNYGTSPECTLHKRMRVEGCGTVEAYLSVSHGRIEKAVFQGDFFSAREPSELAQMLIGCRTERDDYEKVLENTDVGEYFLGMTEARFLELMEK